VLLTVEGDVVDAGGEGCLKLFDRTGDGDEAVAASDAGDGKGLDWASVMLKRTATDVSSLLEGAAPRSVAARARGETLLVSATRGEAEVMDWAILLTWACAATALRERTASAAAAVRKSGFNGESINLSSSGCSNKLSGNGYSDADASDRAQTCGG
jgi:hypothetical protein